MRPLQVCLVSSEATPFAKTGGLADVASALARHLGKRKHDVRLVLPLYRRVQQGTWKLEPVHGLQDIPIELAGRRLWFSVWTTPLPGSTTRAWFVRCPELYDRDGLYTQDPDEHLRFALLNRAAPMICQWTQWAPDVMHVNDWHAALIPLYLRTVFGWDRLFQRTRTVLTLHNVGYQGVVGADKLRDLELHHEPALVHQEDLRAGTISFLRTGLLYADALTTVSETYAREIQTDELGMGLQDLLRLRSNALVGIVNGVDYDVWDPSHDALIPARYTPQNLAGKRICRDTLLARHGIPASPEVPVFGIVSRLTVQKGFELVAEAMPVVLQREDVRLVVLGSGEERYERFFRSLQQSFPTRVAYATGYDEALSHAIEAGADMFLMPSRYEPCGLNQMYSLRYGTVPIVRRTGGLADTVRDWDPRRGTGTGFLFEAFRSDALLEAVSRALAAWRDRASWTTLVRNGMAEDFSWEIQVQRYEDLYRRITGVV
jgi:starch synthase